MELYNYCIIGGGPAGIGFLDSIRETGETSVRLFEGRDTLCYTLEFMPLVKKKSPRFPLIMSGTEFREKLLNTTIESSFINLKSRLIGIDAAHNTLTINIDGKKNLSISYRKLIIAAGAVQSIYGHRLLPGFRGAGTFTTYQVSEMLTRYNFVPGKKIALVGETEYSLETYHLAQKAEMEVLFFSNSGSNGSIPYREIHSLHGNEHFEGLTIMGKGDRKEYYEADSLAVDGDFIMEHKMRELLDAEWDIDSWKLETKDNQSLQKVSNIHITGDALKPHFNFMKQYENGFYLARSMK